MGVLMFSYQDWIPRQTKTSQSGHNKLFFGQMQLWGSVGQRSEVEDLTTLRILGTYW